MRTKQLIRGLNNNQKILVVLNDIGFVTTVKYVFEMPYPNHQIVIQNVLEEMADKESNTINTQVVLEMEEQPDEIFSVQIELLPE
ncbi:MAG: hypothetical protein EBU90_30215 [Proteobacteria bacterium]|nr:hypothetical protein [Pseudomonadota bacterium]